jgi:hypothetical protein
MLILAVVSCGLSLWRLGLTLDGCQQSTSNATAAMPRAEALAEIAAAAEKGARAPKAPPPPEDPRVERWRSLGHALSSGGISEPLPEDTVTFLLEGLPVGEPNAALAFCSLIDLAQKGAPALRAQAKRIVAKGMASERAALQEVLNGDEENVLLDQGAAAAEHGDCQAGIQDLYTFEKDAKEFLAMAAGVGLKPAEDLDEPDVRGPRRRQFFFAMFDERVTSSKMKHGKRH